MKYSTEMNTYVHQKTYREIFLTGQKLESIHKFISSALAFLKLCYIYTIECYIAMKITEMQLHAIMRIKEGRHKRLYYSIYNVQKLYIYTYIHVVSKS